MPCSLRPRNSIGQAITTSHLREDSSLATSLASSPLDTPERSSSSSLSSLEDQGFAVPFPELEVPILDFEIPDSFDPQLRHTKTKPLTPISAIPEYNLDLFFALVHPIANMPAIETPQIFHGDGCKTENHADFLKSFSRAMRQQSIISSSDKLDAFGDYLSTGSEAEVWFKGLMPSQKSSWTLFVVEFETQWPPIIIAKKTQVEYEKELLEYLLTDAEVGMKMTQDDKECWSHKAWATRAGITKSTAMIWQVRGRLPSVIKDLLKDDEYKDWTAFTKEVKELKGNRLLEKKEQHIKQEHKVSQLRADVVRLQQRNTSQNPIATIQNQLS
ncbi:hypothetical protein DFH29DRAFT_877275 [Suillus ampliporus]|nr:hypothetical protein DFH29DRAFT_877275 [Suillus ampliporus]